MRALWWALRAVGVVGWRLRDCAVGAMRHMCRGLVRVLAAHRRSLRTQLKNALEQYDLREKHFDKLLQTKELEKKLVQAQAAQELQAHKADMLTVRWAWRHRSGPAVASSCVLIPLVFTRRDSFEPPGTRAILGIAGGTRMRGFVVCSLAARTRGSLSTDCCWCDVMQIEKELREQLQLYSSKFKGFQETLVSSNSLFETVKHDLEQVRTLRRLLPLAVWTLAAHSTCVRRHTSRRTKHGVSCRSRLYSSRRRFTRVIWHSSRLRKSATKPVRVCHLPRTRQMLHVS